MSLRLSRPLPSTFSLLLSVLAWALSPPMALAETPEKEIGSPEQAIESSHLLEHSPLHIDRLEQRFESMARADEDISADFNKSLLHAERLYRQLELPI